ncbi:MAG: hypothetical protein DHS20C18_26780 [Saprospiraceae bacterium]|nr:MAG: hypothetical protein DHS20C18_26780 [Saprospiraceae bacterium]
MACQSSNDGDGEDRLLAKVQNKSLYLSEMDGMFPLGTTSEDSSLIINAYLSRWIKDALLLYEAERNIPSDLNIDKLVRDYRASLIRHNYEQIIVEQRLDSTVSQAELTAFYEENKEQYQLETPIIRCYFIKVPLPVPESSKLRRLWNSSSMGAFHSLSKYCDEHAEAQLLEDSVWYNVEKIAMELPKGTLTADNVGSKREFTQRDGKYQYYFRLFELKKRKDIAPLSYIEDQARKVILHNRKIKLLQEAKEELYDRESRRDNIQVFVE